MADRDACIRVWVGALFVGASLLCAPFVASAACDCPTSGSSPYCTATSVSYASGWLGNGTVEVRFGDPDGSGSRTNSYVCGQYANGDYWVLGQNDASGRKVVRMESVSPAWTGRLHGHVANPGPNTNSVDGQWVNASAPDSLPRSYDVSATPIISFVKAVSATTRNMTSSIAPCRNDGSDGTGDSKSCLQFAGVVTLVRDEPVNSGDLFRPGFAGSAKEGPFTVAEITKQIAGLPSVAPVPATSSISLQAVANRFRWLQYENGTCGWTCIQGMPPRDNFGPPLATAFDTGSSYGQSIMGNQMVALLRILNNDFDRSLPQGSVSRKVAIHLVQAGIDYHSLLKVGWGTAPLKQPAQNGGWGGIFTGRKPLALFAAWALNHPTMKARISNEDNFYEDVSTYLGNGGVPLFGLREGAICTSAPADNWTSSEQSVRIYCDAGGRQDSNCSTQEKQYPQRVSNQYVYLSLFVTMTGLQPLFNDDAFIAYGRAWKTGRPGADPGAGQCLYCAVNPAKEAGTCQTGYVSTLGEQMWASYKDFKHTPTVPGPEMLPAPIQLE